MEIENAIYAARRNDESLIRSWLENGGNPDQYDSEGWTPLLTACARGHEKIVKILLENKTPADIDMAHKISGGLPIHFAGHSGNVSIAEMIMTKKPEHLESVWLINGHTLLLQCAFYGHLDLARFALEKGADTAATTLRGLGAMEFAKQFQNRAMIELLNPYDKSENEKKAYYTKLLKLIEKNIPESEKDEQEKADRLNSLITKGLSVASENPALVDETVEVVRKMVENEKTDVNRLAGVLSQPPLVVSVTGTNGSGMNESVKELRLKIAHILLENGADPTCREIHPMGVHAIIRACVFNHLDILKLIEKHIDRKKLADAINEIPIVNGLTALHDTVLRAGMVGSDRLEGYLEQMRWCVGNGGRYDIEDFSGRTQLSIAENTADQTVRNKILTALGVKQ
jgi:hypothetical protein